MFDTDPATGERRLLMSMTPYPFSDDRIENPSMLRSHDGTSFETLEDLDNPLEPPPPIDHNDDPDIRWDPVNGEYEMLYLETEAPDKQTVVALRTADLVSWERTDAIVYDLAHGDDFIVSPAVVYDGTTTRMFYVNLSTPSFAQRLQVLTSDDGVTWDRTTKQSVPIDLGGITPWHIDVVSGPAGYAMLISGYVSDFGHQDLYVATSPDLETWTLRPEPLLTYTDPALGVESLYRSSGVVAGNTLVVWYSMKLRL
jgi:predicted GH43/DUF377 family glycosyl hydrolase